jgi:hypothetical protein
MKTTNRMRLLTDSLQQYKASNITVLPWTKSSQNKMACLMYMLLIRQELEDHTDKNTQKIGRVRGKMMKLLEKSSTCCLGIIIFLEIAAIILLFLV